MLAALFVGILLVVLLGALGFAVHVLWTIAVVVLIVVLFFFLFDRRGRHRL